MNSECDFTLCTFVGMYPMNPNTQVYCMLHKDKTMFSSFHVFKTIYILMFLFQSYKNKSRFKYGCKERDGIQCNRAGEPLGMKRSFFL